jgi:DNA transformation protein
MSNEYIDFLREVFAQFGAISARKMFGGYGIYHQGLMFALVADDTLYLKVDSASKPEFEQHGLTAFQFDQRGKPISMSYFLAPDIIMDDPEAAVYWAELAFAAALRAQASRALKQSRKASKPT